jgi:diguanylate cyclase (GGDEF)-like protein/PAS domain S-box-containing protein
MNLSPQEPMPLTSESGSNGAVAERVSNFKLTRYFSIACLIGMLIVVAVLVFFYRQFAFAALAQQEARNNANLAQVFASTLWPSHANYVKGASAIPKTELQQRPEVARIREDVLRQMHGLSVVKAKIYNLEGLTVFSTDPKQIGGDQGTNGGFLAAKAGETTSEITFRDRFDAFEQVINDRNLVSSYVPIRTHQGAPIEGVMEVYSDVTGHVENLRSTTLKIAVVVLGSLSVLYFFLFSIVRRGERVIHTQAAEELRAIKLADATRAQLAAIVEGSNDAIVSRAPDDTIVSWNAAAERMFGWSAEIALGTSFSSLLSSAGEALPQHFEGVLRGEIHPWFEEVRPCKDGSSIHVQTTLSAVKDEHGNILFVSCNMRDVTERVKAEQHIQQLATKDALTGLPNRGMLMEQIQISIARAARLKTAVALMFVDLDRFKEVNDALGHAAGDELLRECAKRLTGCVREVDIVARLGGDEFVVVLTDIIDNALVSTTADRILKLLSAPYNLHGHDALASASIGICLYPADGDDAATLTKNADIAMYHAKELGRNNFQFYAEEMNQRRAQRLQLERELRAALENNEFVLHYQPQVDIRSGAILGAESLIRWQHPTRGLLYPGEFVPVAEETGLVIPIGDWVLNHACRTIKDWRAKAVGIPYIVVNVSPGQLSDALVTQVRQALVNHGIEPAWLMLEITETMLMEQVEEAILILRRIRALGIRIAMDDFGTGYSSLSVLQRLPLDTLKIDRSFVSAIDDDSDNARAVAIIGAIIAIAKELNLSVVAEGVESPTQLAFLRTLNCDAYQGYLYSKAVDTQSLVAQFAAPVKSVLEDAQGRPITITLTVNLELPTEPSRSDNV